MPLKALPADPEPTDEELAPYLGKAQLLPKAIGRRFAALLWQADKQREDPNLFLVPFANVLPNYGTYLDSPEWGAIKRRILGAAQHRCRACDRKARDVHHRDYRPRVLAGDDDNALIALCRPCHDRIEKMKREGSWNEAEKLLATLVLENEIRNPNGGT